MFGEDLNLPTPAKRPGMLIPGMILGGAIGAMRSKSDVSEGLIKGAAVGALVVFGFRLLLGTAAIGTYAYGVSTVGRDATNHAFNQAFKNVR